MLNAAFLILDSAVDDDSNEPPVLNEREQTTLQNIIDQEEADFQLALRLSQMPDEEPQRNEVMDPPR